MIKSEIQLLGKRLKYNICSVVQSVRARPEIIETDGNRLLCARPNRDRRDGPSKVSFADVQLRGGHVHQVALSRTQMFDQISVDVFLSGVELHSGIRFPSGNDVIQI